MSALSIRTPQDRFTAALSAVDDADRFAFRRRLRDQDFEEALAEARAAAWSAWAGMIAKGRDPVEAGVHGVANNAVRNVRQGRRIGNAHCGRGAMDVFNRKAQAACGFTVVSLDSGAEIHDEPSSRGDWLDWLAGDNRVTPADEACFRLDFRDWLSSLPERKRRIAELLAGGETVTDIAQRVGVSQGRVSQVRTELEASWAAFQAEALAL